MKELQDRLMKSLKEESSEAEKRINLSKEVVFLESKVDALKVEIDAHYQSIRENSDCQRGVVRDSDIILDEMRVKLIKDKNTA